MFFFRELNSYFKKQKKIFCTSKILFSIDQGDIISTI